MNAARGKSEHLAALLVAEVLDLSPDQLSASSCIYDFPSWDSLGQLSIVLALEERFGCIIDDEGLFERLTTFAAICEFVAEHSKEKAFT